MENPSGRFRNILIQNELQEMLFAQVVFLLTARGLILKKRNDRRFCPYRCTLLHQKQEETAKQKKGEHMTFRL